LDTPDGANTCPPSKKDPYAKFGTDYTKYQDNVADWPSVEPADDYTVISLLTFARMTSFNVSSLCCSYNQLPSEDFPIQSSAISGNSLLSIALGSLLGIIVIII
jgi:hypothetical protein